MDIYNTINAVMSDIGVIGKDKRNQQQNWAYRGIDDVMNALQPSMIKHGLFMVPTVLEQHREERQTSRGGNLIYSVCTVRYTFYAQDGSNISCVVIGEGMDSGDKSSNKAMAIAMKYACFQVFCIPTEETHNADANLVDPDATTPDKSMPVDKQAKPATEKELDDFKAYARKLGIEKKEQFYRAVGVQITDIKTTGDIQFAMDKLKKYDKS